MLEEDIKTEVKKKKSGGPPNRLNDMNYKDWMKFQKSFFQYESSESLLLSYCTFFTKKEFVEGVPSKILIVGVEKKHIDLDREFTFISLDEFLISNNLSGFDYAFIWLPEANPKMFSVEYQEQLFRNLNACLYEDRYCTVFVAPNESNDRFPLHWELTYSGRRFLKLRDEKIGLINSKEVLYCLNFQRAEEMFDYNEFDPSDFCGNIRSTTVWTIPKPPPRKKNEKLHPAKFPETLIQDFIVEFSNPDDLVFDPMCGTGSTIIAALNENRNGLGIELSEEFAKICESRIYSKQSAIFLFDELNNDNYGRVIQGNASHLNNHLDEKEQIDYVVTSPPYWSMLNNKGSENQRKRREENLKLNYSDEVADLGNIEDYFVFVDSLVSIYEDMAKFMKKGAVATIIVKNVKRQHTVYPLAWDLIRLLCSKSSCFNYVGNTLWLQDDIGLKPFAIGTHWVSNTLHQYCFHLEKK